jgi:hypothetical protein
MAWHTKEGKKIDISWHNSEPVNVKPQNNISGLAVYRPSAHGKNL